MVGLMSYYNAVNHKHFLVSLPLCKFQIIPAVQHTVFQEVNSKHISPVLQVVWLPIHYSLLNVGTKFL